MTNLFYDGSFLFAVIPLFVAVGFLVRGLKVIPGRFLSRCIIPLLCVWLSLVLFFDVIFPDWLRISGIIIGLMLLGIIGVDIIAGTFLGSKEINIFTTGKKGRQQEYLTEIIKALETLRARRTGALIVIEKKEALEEFLSGGILFDAEIKAEILTALFATSSPVHDGAVIVSKGRVKKVRAILPLLTNGDAFHEFGTRHRAALGITENTDAVALVASEERGELSVAFRGKLLKANSQKEFRKIFLWALKAKGRKKKQRVKKH